MADQEKWTLLIIADISGYTSFMLKNAKTLGHAQAVITALMTAVIRETKFPLKIAKLEGDAIFLYAAKRNASTWRDELDRVGKGLNRLYTVFTHKAAGLKLSDNCGCDACRHVDHLTIKFVVHYGTALFYRLGTFDELAGPDVIILHRLLKNSIGSNEYFLFTEAAFRALGFDECDPLFIGHTENYDDVGTIPIRVRSDLSALRFTADGVFAARHSSRWSKMKGMAEKMWAMVTARHRVFAHLVSD